MFRLNRPVFSGDLYEIGTQTYTYDCMGNVLTAKDDKARAENLPYSVSYAYDHAGRVLAETDVFGNAATNTYDNAGQLLTATDRSGMVMSYTYDALGRATLVHDGSKYVRSYYDDNGNLVKEIEASSASATRGHIKTYEYDDLNRLTYSFNSTSDTDLASYNGVEEYYSYDVMGNVLTTSQHSDGGHFGTTYTYDILGRKTSMKDAEDNTETYTYNLDGTMKTKTDREGTVFTYSNYNVFKNTQRIKAVNGDKTQTIGFGYDMMNNLTSESNSESDHSVSYSYDFLGRLIKQDGFYVVNEYAYDTLGNRTSLTLNRQAISGNLYEISAQSYTYDAKSRLTESTAFDKTAEYSYNESDQLTNKRLGVLRTQRNRNNKNLVTREFIVEPTSDVSNKTYHEVDYTYDYKSDLTGENIDSDRYSFSVWYTYDGAGRLKNASIGDNHRLGTHERIYGYDSNGNINMNYKGYNGQLGSTGTKTTYTYELNNHIWGLSWLYDENNTQKGFQVFESDANGNRYKDAGKTAEFDLFNRMVKYTDENGAETTYTYTASGLRESKTTSDGVQTFYVWDGGNMVLEYVVTDPDNLVGEYRKFYIYGADGLAYRKDLDGSIYTYNTNYRGDVLSVMDAEQNIKAEYQYDAYGNLVESNIAAGFSDNFGYRGEYHDPESGYIYLRNRYLDPKTGSFTTEDPIRDGLNWFSYCGGNPIRFTDPHGLWGEDVHWAETKKWASPWVGTKGFTEYDAGMLAYYDNNTDNFFNKTSPIPGFGNQSYHFNTNAEGVDSRLQHASKNLNNAIWSWNQAKINYKNNLEGLKNLKQGSGEYIRELNAIEAQYRADKDYALKFLGEGLHAIQDIEAHGNIGKGDPIASHLGMEGVDDRNYDWTDLSRTNVERSVNQKRFNATKKATDNYLALFFDGIN